MAYAALSATDSDQELSSSKMATPTQKEDTTLLNGKGSSASLPPAAQPAQNGGGRSNKYPYGVFFIVGNEFCERFSYYGMRAILVLYLTDWLGYRDDTATAIFHFFVALCYFSPLLGAIIADGFWGKYKTILYISIVYCVGNLLMSFTAFPPPHPAGPIIALILIGLGTGGIKPCVSAFGGDQFSSDQEKWLIQFFSVFYFAINLGSLFSMVVTPLIRQNVHCFGTNCFPLAFGIPAILMFTSLILFVVGRSTYKIYPPTGNVIGNMIMAIGRAIKNRSRSDKTREHWLDYADDKYDVDFLADVRSVLKVFLLFLPLPLFWALFDQQGSRWILQAREMDLHLGNWDVPPDMVPVLNPALLILLIPLSESCCYPLLEKCNILTRPLQRMVVGMSLAAFAFILAAVLQIKIDQAESARFTVNENEASLRYINAVPCPVHIQSPWLNDSLHVSHGTEPHIMTAGSYNINVHAVDSTGSCDQLSAGDTISLPITVTPGKAYYIALYAQNNKLHAQLFEYPTKNPQPAQALVGLLYLSDTPLAVQANHSRSIGLYSVTNIQHAYIFSVQHFQQSIFRDIAPDKYRIKVPVTSSEGTETVELGELVSFANGGIYTVVIQPNVSNPSQLVMVKYEDFPPNDISVLWQIPQYVCITLGEILFSISGLSFAYSQAPASMKSVVQAGWLLTVAVGNVIDIIVAGAQLLPTQTAEFFFFAAMMGVVTIVFGVMSYFYNYVKHERSYELHDDDDPIINQDELEEHTRSPDSYADPPNIR